MFNSTASPDRLYADRMRNSGRRQQILQGIDEANQSGGNPQNAWGQIARLDDEEAGLPFNALPDTTWSPYLSAVKYSGGNNPRGNAQMDAASLQGLRSIRRFNARPPHDFSPQVLQT